MKRRLQWFLLVSSQACDRSRDVFAISGIELTRYALDLDESLQKAPMELQSSACWFLASNLRPWRMGCDHRDSEFKRCAMRYASC